MDENNYPEDEEEFGSYEDYDVNPEENRASTQSSQKQKDPPEEDDNEEGKAKKIEDKVNNKQDGQYKGKNNNSPINALNKLGNSGKSPISNITSKLGGNAGAGGNPLEMAKEQGKEMAKEAAKKAAKKAAKAVAKAAGKALLGAVKYLFLPPILFYTLGVIAVLLIIALIFIIIMMAMSSAGAVEANMDPANGVFATSFGITGEVFYGGRFIYSDPEQAKTDIRAYYDAFSADFLDAIDNMESIDLNIVIDKESITEEMTEMIAKAMSGSIDNLTVEEHIALIDHFGYTDVELDAIQVSFVDYFNNNTALLNLENYTGDLVTDLNNVYDSTFADCNVTAPLYYVKDVILENAEAMIPSLAPENYVAFIYMPKTEAYLTRSTFAFYFPEGDDVNEIYTEHPYATQIQFEFITVVDGEETSQCNETADSTWWRDGTSQQLAEVQGMMQELPVFTSLDLNNLIEEKSIYSLLFVKEESNSTEDEEIDISYTNFSIEELKKYCSITQSEEESNYYEISYLPTNDTTYFYIKINSDGIFQYCEYEAEFYAKNKLNN